MISYNGIIEYFKEVANKHTQINSFSFGDIDDADLDKITEYPLLHVGVTGAQIDERVISFDINIMLIEIIDDKGDTKVNEKFALSNSLQILQDLQTEFLKGSSIVTPNTKLTGNSLSCQPITGNYNNRVVGWTSIMTIEGINESEPCNIPYEFITSWNGDTPSTPIQALVKYAWYSATEKQQNNIDYSIYSYVRGFSAMLEPIATIEPVFNAEVSGTDFTLAYDFKNNGIHFKGKDPTNLNRIHTITLNDVFFIKLDQLTGGDNLLFTVINDNTTLVDIVCNDGAIFMKDKNGVPSGRNYYISGLNSNNPKLTDTNAVIRDQPITIALKVTGVNEVALYVDGYGDKDVFNITALLTGSGKINLGARDTSQQTETNFIFKEFIYSYSINNLNDDNIKDVIRWLNAK